MDLSLLYFMIEKSAPLKIITGIIISEENFDNSEEAINSTDSARYFILLLEFFVFDWMRIEIDKREIICKREEGKSMTTSEPFPILNGEKIIKNNDRIAVFLFHVFNISRYKTESKKVLKRITDNLDKKEIKEGLFCGLNRKIAAQSH